MGATNDAYLSEVHRLLQESERNGIALRLLGSLAYRLHCSRYSGLFDQMNRQLTDIDFGARRSERTAVRTFFEQQGYQTDQDILVAFEGMRFAFDHPETKVHVDVFIDQLQFCHTIDFSRRLDLDRPTIPLPELLLEKMQIVQINAKDIKDTIVLMLEHDLGGPGNPEVLDVSYLCELLCQDWGFYFTTTQNLRKVRQLLPDFPALSDEQREVVGGRIDRLLTIMEETPKTLRWKARAALGTRVRWYNEVDEKKNTFGV